MKKESAAPTGIELVIFYRLREQEQGREGEGWREERRQLRDRDAAR